MIEEVTDVTIGEEYIDQYGHVNYKAAPAMLEEFQDALLFHAGVTFDGIEKDFDLRSFVKKLEVTWDGELRKGNECWLSTTLELGNTSMKFRQVLSKDGSPVVTQFMVVVLVDSAGKPTTIPAELRKKLGEEV